MTPPPPPAPPPPPPPPPPRHPASPQLPLPLAAAPTDVPSADLRTHADGVPQRPGYVDPWFELPRLDLPIVLEPSGLDLRSLIELPEGSALTLAELQTDESHGRPRLVAARYGQTGGQIFYPASTIKWITAAIAVEWMQRHGLNPETVIQVGDDRPATLRELILASLVMSDNDAFNALQEAVGFAHTHAVLRSWGVVDGLIRRHFTRPHWNHSRPVTLHPPGGPSRTLAARPAVDLPLSRDPRPAPLGNPEANAFTTDDLVRVAAATLTGPTRDCPSFPLLTAGLAWTNQNYLRRGLTRLTAQHADRPAFVTLQKPGWWPPDGANSELAYIYDVRRRRHCFLAVYIQGGIDQAEAAMGQVAHDLFGALHDGSAML